MSFFEFLTELSELFPFPQILIVESIATHENTATFVGKHHIKTIVQVCNKYLEKLFIFVQA